MCLAQPLTPQIRKEPTVIDISTSKDNSKTPPTNAPQYKPLTTIRKLTCPLELQELVKAEKRRAAQMAANLEVCTAAINSIEDALTCPLIGIQNSFTVSLKSYNRNAIA